jgi:hypothetical protein
MGNLRHMSAMRLMRHMCAMCAMRHWCAMGGVARCDMMIPQPPNHPTT